MLRITRQADYGIVLLAIVARCPARAAWTAAELAEESRVPLAMVSKILKRLAREGILISRRGPKGGYRLGRPPEAISVVEIIGALDGPIAITECADQTNECELQCSCTLHPAWTRINAAIHAALEGISLQDMLRPAELATPRSG